LSFEPFLAFFSGIQPSFESDAHFFFLVQVLKQLRLNWALPKPTFCASSSWVSSSVQEPSEISIKRAWSFSLLLPLPSAMFDGMETAARGN
jgi:hypothetical protein